MSSNCTITNTVVNSSGYSFTPNRTSTLSSGSWLVSPQPIPVGANGMVAFQAAGVPGAMGTMGQAGYDVMSNGSSVGTITLVFSDPNSGDNTASGTTTVSGLSISADMPGHGSTVTCAWTLS